MPRKKFENSVDPGSCFTEADSWWYGYPVKCASCETDHTFEEGDEVTERVQDKQHTLAYVCEGGSVRRPCNNTIWVFEDVVEDWKKQRDIEARVAALSLDVSFVNSDEAKDLEFSLHKTMSTEVAE